MLILKLFTSESADDIRERSGSFSWKLNTAKANLCSYAVLFHNARARTGPKGATHREGFLVGRIKALQPEADGRHAVIFDALANLPEPDSWPSGHQNPVNYAEVDDQAFDRVAFEQLEVNSIPVVAPSASTGMTIAQAKAELARFYDVPINAIEIIIRG